jgi:hypothetical protein
MNICPVPLNYMFSVTGVIYTRKIDSVERLWHWLYDDARVFMERKKKVFINATVDQVQ